MSAGAVWECPYGLRSAKRLVAWDVGLWDVGLHPRWNRPNLQWMLAVAITCQRNRMASLSALLINRLVKRTQRQSMCLTSVHTPDSRSMIMSCRANQPRVCVEVVPQPAHMLTEVRDQLSAWSVLLPVWLLMALSSACFARRSSSASANSASD